MQTAALVLAAGRGERAGGPVPKQFAQLSGGTPIARSTAAFLRHERIDAVCVVIAPGSQERARETLADLNSPQLLPLVEGGSNRQESALAGLRALRPHAPARVLIHDAVRPDLKPALIDRMLDALQSAPAAVPVLPVTDCLWETGTGGECLRPLPRESLCAAQTPQGFDYAAILAAHEAHAGTDLADDASVARLAGLPVETLAGDPANRKLTTPEDLARPAALRVGQGVDVHAFGPGDGLQLCGVQIPFEQTLEGHSDADPGLHALADAIYGALGDADIGTHFPPDDPRWKDCDSSVFVRHAARRATDAGYQILHVDLTLVCERPTVAPYRQSMRDAVAASLDIDPSQVSIKATTTERLGFTGRGEGIAAFALATLAGCA